MVVFGLQCRRLNWEQEGFWLAIVHLGAIFNSESE